MAAISVFNRDVLPLVPGCPEIIVERNVLHAVVELCQKTLCHQVTLPPVSLIQNVNNYRVFSPSIDLKVYKLMHVFLGEDELHALAQDDFRIQDWYDTSPGAKAKNGRPDSYTRLDQETLNVFPVPRLTADLGTLTVRAAMIPSLDATSIDDRFTDLYHQAVLAKTLARVLMIPQKPWSDPRMAMGYDAEFIRQANRILLESKTSYSRAERQVRFVKV